MQLFEDLDVLLFAVVSQMNLVGHGNRMDRKRKVSQVFNP